MFSDTFAGIAPSSVPSFISAQMVGGVLAFALITGLYPGLTGAQAAAALQPHHLGSTPEESTSMKEA